MSVFGELQVEGRRLLLDGDGALKSNDAYLTHECCNATIAVGAESANVRAITVQLQDAYGNDLRRRAFVRAHVMADANGDAFVTTGGSTGIAIGTDGALLPVVAKRSFILVSEDDGDIDLTWTDTGTEVAFLHLELPNGKRVVSAALTNAV